MCNLTGALIAKQLQALPGISLSASEYAALLTISIAIVVLLWCAVGFLIFWRRSEDWLALLAAFFLVMWGTTGNNPGFVLVLTYPVLALPVSLVGFLGQVSIFVFFLLFPNGRIVPRWTALILLVVIINAFLNNFPFPHVNLRNELACLAHPAGEPRSPWSHHRFANLPLQACVHSFLSSANRRSGLS